MRLPAKLVVYGDSRPKIALEFWRPDASVPRRAVIERIAAERPALVVHSGDLVRVGASAEEWRGFDSEIAPIRDAGIPFFPALGNHEYVGAEAEAMANFEARFPLLAGRRWYDLRAGPLAVVVIDTNLEDLSSARVEEQCAWYRGRLRDLDADPAVRAVFVVGHHPPLTNAVVHGPSAAVRARFLEPAKEHAKVKAFFSGHVHAYERFEEDGIHLVVSGGGGAPRMEVRDGLRARDLFSGPPVRPFHYCLVTVEERRAVVDVIMLDDATGAWARGDGFVVGW
jgi:3',5'-cyclic AMP phosphodiesterase CpdA